MRTIKFRAWDIERKLMCVVTELDPLNGRVAVSSSPDAPDYFLQADEHKLMQFTGLTDKNGKEIYEGDVVRCSTYYKGPKNYEVVFRDGAFAIGLTYLGLQDGAEVFEVIGNVWETPSLLQGQDKDKEK